MSTQSAVVASTNNSLFDSNFSDQIPESAHSVDSLTDSERSNTAGHSTNNENAVSNEDLANSTITLRSLVSTKEAGVIIGKNGANVAELRENTGVKAGVSKSMGGLSERILTITGTIDSISEAYSHVASSLLESSVNASSQNTFNHNHHQSAANSNFTFAVIRLLISHHQMGTIIGRQGMKIKAIQENCKVRMVASKGFLPNSTERIVEVQGKPDAIQSAIWEIARCLVEETDRNAATIYYNPQPGSSYIFNNNNSNNNNQSGGRFNNSNSNGNGRFNPQFSRNNGNNYNTQSRTFNYHNNENENGDEEPTVQEQMAISSDMVGCIIGRGGSKISEIRRESGARISIAKNPHDASGDRMFTISGTKEANERAFKLLFEQLENEKERRAVEGLKEQEQEM